MRELEGGDGFSGGGGSRPLSSPGPFPRPSLKGGEGKGAKGLIPSAVTSRPHLHKSGSITGPAGRAPFYTPVWSSCCKDPNRLQAQRDLLIKQQICLTNQIWLKLRNLTSRS